MQTSILRAKTASDPPVQILKFSKIELIALILSKLKRHSDSNFKANTNLDKNIHLTSFHPKRLQNDLSFTEHI
jgi:hypothetical protein